MTGFLAQDATILIDIENEIDVTSSGFTISVTGVTLGAYDQGVSGDQVGTAEYLPNSEKPFFNADGAKVKGTPRPFQVEASGFTLNNIRVGNLHGCGAAAIGDWPTVCTVGSEEPNDISPNSMAVNMVDGSGNAVIEYCYFHDLWAQGVRGNDNSDDNTVKYTLVERASMKRAAGDSVKQQGINFNGSRNTIDHSIVADTWGEGIHPGDNGTVQYCIVSNNSSAGIYADSNGSNIILKYNLLIGRRATDVEDFHVSNGFVGKGIRVNNEVGSGGTVSDIKIFGNIIINRYAGIEIQNDDYPNSTLELIYVYNNLFIDNYDNVKFQHPNEFDDTSPNTIKLKNNVSILVHADTNLQKRCASPGCALLEENWLDCDNNVWYGESLGNFGNESCTNDTYGDPKFDRTAWRTDLNNTGMEILKVLAAGDFAAAADGEHIGDGLDNLGATYDELLTVMSMDFFTVGDTLDLDDLSITLADQNDYGDHDQGPIVYTPGPVRSNQFPTSLQLCTVSPNTTVEISLTTLASATCKLDTDGGEAYSAMATTFESGAGTSHTHDVSQVCDGLQSTIYAVRCSDTATSDVNVTDLLITVSVADEVDSPQPAPLSIIRDLNGITVMPGGKLNLEP